MEHRRRHQRGIALLTMALWVTAFLGLAVLGIDVGRVAFTATEVHNVADIAATAGVVAFVRGRSATYKTDAQAVVAQNFVDGQQASIAASDVAIGNYNQTSGTFTAGGTPSNAVRAHATATVNNVMAGVLGQPTSTVERNSIAAFKSLGETRAGFPGAMGSCFFDQYPCYQQGCSEPIIEAPNPSNNFYWAGLDNTNPSGGSQSGSFYQFLPTLCGGSGRTVDLTAGTSLIYLNNGVADAVYADIARCIGQQFVIPVVQGCTYSSNGNSNAAITGFATIQIDNVVCPQCPTRDAGNKYIFIHVVFNDDPPCTAPCTNSSGGSCPGCGTGRVALVQ